MRDQLLQFATVFMAFFAIMNPLANSTLFVALTDGLQTRQQRLIAMRSVVVAFIIIALFAIAGRAIFSVFGITLPAFRIAGGALIGLIGYHMLQGESTSFHKPTHSDIQQSDESAVDIAVTPLGMPILAGPGTIATAMNFSAQASMLQIAEVLLAFALICGLTFVAFLCGPWFVRVLGRNAIKVVTRLMGLILAVIGVQMLIDGIRGAINT